MTDNFICIFSLFCRGWRVYLQDEYGTSQDALSYMIETYIFLSIKLFENCSQSIDIWILVDEKERFPHFSWFRVLLEYIGWISEARDRLRFVYCDPETLIDYHMVILTSCTHCLNFTSFRWLPDAVGAQCLLMIRLCAQYFCRGSNRRSRKEQIDAYAAMVSVSYICYI